MFELLTTQTSAAGIREAGARSGLGLVLDDNDRKVLVSRKSLIEEHQCHEGKLSSITT